MLMIAGDAKDNKVGIDFDSLVQLLAEKFNVSKCSLMLLEEHQGEKVLVIRASVGMEDDLVPRVKMSPASSAIGNITDIGEGILVENIEEDPRYKRKSKKQYMSKSFICVPIKAKQRIFGLISITDKKNPPYSLIKPELIELCTLVSYLFRDFKYPVSISAKTNK